MEERYTWKQEDVVIIPGGGAMLLREMVRGKDYDPAQPRDEAGRWSETGGSESISAHSIVSNAPPKLQAIIDSMTLTPMDMREGVAANVTGAVNRNWRWPPTKSTVIHEAAHCHQSQILRDEGYKPGGRHDQLIREFERLAREDNQSAKHPLWGNINGEELWPTAAGFYYGGAREMMLESSPRISALLNELYGGAAAKSLLSVRWECLRAKALAGAEWQKYDPNQKRAPAGTTGGGRWISHSGGFPVVVSSGDQDVPSPIEMTQRSLETFPDWALQGVSEVMLISEGGREFDAGGQHFQEGGHWDSRSNTIRVFDAGAQYQAGMSSILGHEVGHSLFDMWWSRAVAEEDEAYKQHPDWFDHAGNVLPEYKKMKAEQYPFRAAQEMFTSYWGKEDGITDYSRAWAKAGQFHETVAEMSEMYFRHTRLQSGMGEKPASVRAYVSRTVRGYGKVEGAPHLAKAFTMAMDAFRKQYGGVGRKPAVGYVSSFYGTQIPGASTKDWKARKFFDAEMQEVSPNNAVLSVEIETDDRGCVVDSTRYFVGGAAAKSLHEMVWGKSFEGHDA